MNIILKLAYAAKKAMERVNDINYLMGILFRTLLATLNQGSSSDIHMQKGMIWKHEYAFKFFEHNRRFHETINYISENENEVLHWMHVIMHYIDIQLHCCWLLHEQAHRNQQDVAR